MQIAFYAPLKAPTHPVPSGDREMARNLKAAMALDGRAEVVLASTLRTRDGAGDHAVQARLFDAAEAGVVSDFAQPAAEGRTYVVVAYDVTNTTAEDADFIPVRITGLGSAVFESFNDCFLDVEASAQRGLEINRFELAAGQTVRLAACLDVPTEERSTFAVRIQNSFSVSGEHLLFPGQG